LRAPGEELLEPFPAHVLVRGSWRNFKLKSRDTVDGCQS
jgi:hypothetical protein